jgi:hypothetical protein
MGFMHSRPSDEEHRDQGQNAALAPSLLAITAMGNTTTGEDMIAEVSWSVEAVSPSASMADSY